RTKALFDRFVISFNEADILVVCPIFSAGENAIDGVSAESLAQGIKEHGHKEVIFCKSQEDVILTLREVARPGDAVMTLGAGDVYRIGEKLLDELE
ncbi:MAG TPA: UDP-N-acetylmuramate--L-alanine ligase, partial [Acidobacteriota bacterium]|nr:UDP-N-acetylmuramate--L-alanine ligase [Acidobacteriota bacterium]